MAGEERQEGLALLLFYTCRWVASGKIEADRARPGCRNRRDVARSPCGGTPRSDAALPSGAVHPEHGGEGLPGAARSHISPESGERAPCTTDDVQGARGLARGGRP